jgi:hypothetical protein
MVLFAYAFIQKTREVRRLAAQEAALYNANQQTAADNVQVQRAIRYYKTSAYIEEEARVTLGYTRPGEVAVMSTPRYRPVVHAPPLVPRVQTPPEPTWKQWWRSFFR